MTSCFALFFLGSNPLLPPLMWRYISLTWGKHNVSTVSGVQTLTYMYFLNDQGLKCISNSFVYWCVKMVLYNINKQFIDYTINVFLLFCWNEENRMYMYFINIATILSKSLIFSFDNYWLISVDMIQVFINTEYVIFTSTYGLVLYCVMCSQIMLTSSEVNNSIVSEEYVDICNITWWDQRNNI